MCHVQLHVLFITISLKCSNSKSENTLPKHVDKTFVIILCSFLHISKHENERKSSINSKRIEPF